ncbi:MAG: exopolysaccharide biosynthesis protein [Verrucomicrobiae bacterium]|nr:exopolysaccharide biosynthesis protein [Verrucomicrobiae bacterium]
MKTGAEEGGKEEAQRPGPAGELGGFRPPVPLAPGRRLSDELQRLIRAFEERSVSLREVLEVMHGRGYDMLLILLAIPFCTPIPLPLFSTPFGVVIALIGFRLATGQKPWLPARLLDRRLPARFFPMFLAATRRLVRMLEVLLRPRQMWLVRWWALRRGMGLMILVSGLLLLLPLPIPFSNFLPAMTIVLLACAMLEEDGLAALGGGAFFLLTLGFFAAIVWGGAEVIQWLEDRFGGGLLDPQYEEPLEL